MLLTANTIRSNIKWVALILVVLQGCFLPSIYSLYSDADLVLLPQLKGSWTSTNPSPDTWKFDELSETKNYRLTFRQAANNSSDFDVHFIKLGNSYFMDIFPITEDLYYKKAHNNKINNALLTFNMLPVHTFARVDIVNDKKIILYPFGPSLKDSLPKSARRDLPYLNLADGQVVITAGTGTIQKYLKEHHHDSEVFRDSLVLERK